MTVTVDINVLLDVFQQREPHFAASAQIVSLVASGKLTGICPAHGLATLYYLVRKQDTKAAAEAALDQVLSYFVIGNLDNNGWRRARLLPINDFEDAAVAVVAEVSGSALLLTRNIGDFAQSPVPAITPTDFLSQHTPIA